MNLKLIKTSLEARDTKTFFFEPESPVEFISGQYYYITLPKLAYEDDRGPTRHFTISGSPTEELIRITTRIREQSGYKKTLSELKEGDTVEGRGPNGTFTLETITQSPYVFFAGGIGITPFRSMFKYLIDKNLSLPFYLVYSNSEDEFVFRKEIDEWTDKYDFLKTRYINTKTDGRLDKVKVESLLKEWNIDTNSASFLMSGPPQFVSAVEKILSEINIKSENVHSDKFTGY